MLDEIVLHLRALRADCSKNMAWCSALIWAEKALLLSGNTDDLLWLVDALVTNGQYRQAEEWMANPRYAAKCRASATGRYLASVVAMRLGRAEDALEFLAIDEGSFSVDIGNKQQGARSNNESNVLQTPTMSKATIGAAQPTTLFSHSCSTDEAELTGGSNDGNSDGNSSNSSSGSRDNRILTETVPLNRKALILYMQGAAVVQLSNIGGNEMTPSISRLNAKYGSQMYGMHVDTPTTSGKSRLDESEKRTAARLGHMGMLVTRLWTDSLRADPRCWEAWSGIRERGLLTCQEELRLIDSLDWTACCGGSVAASRFFRSYCLATQTAYSLSDATIEATGSLLSLCPGLIEDPTLRTIQASRLLTIGRARASLEYTVRVLEYRRVPDPIATAIHITALTVLHSKKALFRIAHELAEEFGISSIKRAEIEPADTHTSVSLLASTGGSIAGSTASDSFGSSSVYGPTSTPRGNAMGASVAGTNRIRTGARDCERGSQLAHLPLASLGSVYLQMGDLGMAESCFDASARCLSGYRIAEWLSSWRPLLESLPNSDILRWTASFQVEKSKLDSVNGASLADPQLLNDIGAMYYNRGDMQGARIFFALALAALRLGSTLQSKLYSVLCPVGRKDARSNQRLDHRESQAYSALFKANIGSTLRNIGDYSSALTCLREALAHAPSNSEILLSTAFTLHLSAINSCSSQSAAGFNSELDQAIDTYHRILSDHPGDPVTTDLLTLALELSVSLQSVPLMGKALSDIGKKAEEIDQEIKIREPDELGIPELGVRDKDGGEKHKGLLDFIPRANTGRHNFRATPDFYGCASEQTNDTSQGSPGSSVQNENEQEFEDEDSDEVMDIEEDTDSEDESDMAME
ncbi:anaphase-promoting complex subunit Cut9 [Coemansia erecta]|nr:anaphase-promoting complex subunit Cut9 [Coemansia erecta]